MYYNLRKAMLGFLIFFILIFVGCKTNSLNSEIVICNGNYQHYSGVAADSYGYYNCVNNRKGLLVLSKKLPDDDGKVLLKELPKVLLSDDRSQAVTMINPTESMIYFVFSERKICSFNRNSGEVSILLEEDFMVNYMRLIEDKLYICTAGFLYSLDIDTGEKITLCEGVRSVDFYQNRIYTINSYYDDKENRFSYKVNSMNLDGSDFKDECVLDHNAKDINVSEQGIFYHKIPEQKIMHVSDGIPEEFLERTFQFSLYKNWIYYINSDGRGISRIKDDGSSNENVINFDLKTHLFFIVGDYLIYCNMNGKLYTVKLS